MQKLTAQDPQTKSADLAAENIQHLKEVFPEAFVEGKVDFEVLKQLLGAAVDEKEEKYGLNWHGKRKARQIVFRHGIRTPF
jgi:adenine-specific DNA-methyltransferase